MPITDPQVIAFLNSEIRPVAEKLVRLNVVLDDIIQSWFQVISGAISGNASDDVIEDGREGEGISRITKADLSNFITQLLTIQAQFDGGGVMDVISKPTVRSLSEDL